MRKLIAILCLTVGLLGQAAAAGQADAGQAKSAVCAACHGVDGNSVNPEWPSIAGQHPNYIVAQLQAFKGGQRENPLMTPQAMSLSDQDMEDLAAYFAGQTVKGGTADPKLVNYGEQLYRGGNLESGVAACTACHGPTGRGNLPAGYPALQGQHANYVIAQLKAYASGTRRTDPNQMMRNVSAAMSEDEMRAVASYIQGLRAD